MVVLLVQLKATLDWLALADTNKREEDLKGYQVGRSEWGEKFLLSRKF